MTVYPNVKLNLGLRVLGRRPDGYHELETLFVPCDAFHDRLDLEPLMERSQGCQSQAQAFKLDISGSQYRGWAPEDDLVARAWRLLRDETLADPALAALCPGGLPPVRARLEKNSPVGAGLGGGSADGAFMLLALNEMFGLGLPKERLAALAARLGSDCPFFIYNSPMFATGRGEILEPFALDLSGYRIEVAIPEGVAVSTREAYAGLDAALPAPSGKREATAEGAGASPADRLAPLDPTALRSPLLRDSGSPEMSSFLGCTRGWHGSAGPATAPLQHLPLREALALPVGQWRDAVANDFERSVFPAHPEIAALKAQMYDRGAVYAAMSGSGSAVFGIFPK